MHEIFTWFGNNRKIIGTVIGGLDLILGLHYLLLGVTAVATMWTAIGIVILIDAWNN